MEGLIFGILRYANESHNCKNLVFVMSSPLFSQKQLQMVEFFQAFLSQLYQSCLSLQGSSLLLFLLFSFLCEKYCCYLLAFQSARAHQQLLDQQVSGVTHVIADFSSSSSMQSNTKGKMFLCSFNHYTLPVRASTKVLSSRPGQGDFLFWQVTFSPHLSNG